MIKYNGFEYLIENNIISFVTNTGHKSTTLFKSIEYCKEVVGQPPKPFYGVMELRPDIAQSFLNAYYESIKDRHAVDVF